MLLVLVADVVPVIPATVCDHVIEVGVGEYNPGVLAHGPAHIQWAASGDAAADEGESGLLLRRFPVLRRYRTEPRRYGVQLTVLKKTKKNKKK